jgi:signal transduction histidine kinase
LHDTPSPAADELTVTRHDRLRRAAPAVQHEINNAMMVLHSNLELLGRSVGEGAPRRQLDRALEAARRIEETVRGYLDAARREVSDVAVVAVPAALQQVLPLLRVALGARHGIDAEMPRAMPEARIDRGRLDLALLSLAREAKDRMAAGARLAARVEERGAEVVLILSLPAGAEPQAETAGLLAGAAEATGGRVERAEGVLALAWPRA